MENTQYQNPLPQVSPSRSSYIIAVILLVAAGLGTGFLLSKFRTGSGGSPNTASEKTMIKQSNEEAGTTDTSTFKDYAIGTLEAGGSNGEGTHKLIRPGGSSQTVYLVSSVVDLDTFVGKKIEVYGQTIRAAKVGWLMDVGRVKVTQ